MPFSASRINNHTTFYAKWRLSSVTITFESKGGGDFESITTSTNEVITNLPIPVRDGYTFLGWYDELIPDTLYLESITVKRSHNLIAKWAKNSVQVSFDTNGGNTIAPISAYFGEQLSHIEPAYKEGFKFKAWYLDEELTIPLETDYVVQEDTTLYAAYESIKHTVSFYSHGDNVFSDIYVDYNEKIDNQWLLNAVNRVEKPGFSFQCTIENRLDKELSCHHHETMISVRKATDCFLKCSMITTMG